MWRGGRPGCAGVARLPERRVGKRFLDMCVFASRRSAAVRSRGRRHVEFVRIQSATLGPMPRGRRVLDSGGF
eukprot:5292711-Prymnesium_polylepis.1